MKKKIAKTTENNCIKIIIIRGEKKKLYAESKIKLLIGISNVRSSVPSAPRAVIWKRKFGIVINRYKKMG